MSTTSEQEEAMNWYAIQPDGTAFYWRVANLTTGHVIARGLTREKAFAICEALKGNQERRRASLGAG